MVSLTANKSNKQVTSELAAPGYVPKKPANEGDDDLVVQAVLGRIERRWTRALNKRTMCSVDDLREPMALTVEVTTDNMEYSGSYSPRFFHSDSLKDDVVEEYYVHRFKSDSSKTKPNKKPEPKVVEKGYATDDETAYTDYTLNFDKIETKTESTSSREGIDVDDDVEDSKVVNHIENMVDRYLCRSKGCNNCLACRFRSGPYKDADTRGFGVKQYIARKDANRKVASEKRALESGDGMKIKEFVKWKKQEEKDKTPLMKMKERARRMASFRPIFEEAEFENREKEMKQDKPEEKSTKSYDEFNSLQEEEDEDSWESMSSYSTLTPIGLQWMDEPLSAREMEIAEDVLMGFAQSRGVSLSCLTDLLTDDLFCPSSIRADSLNTSIHQGPKRIQ